MRVQSRIQDGEHSGQENITALGRRLSGEQNMYHERKMTADMLREARLYQTALTLNYKIFKKEWEGLILRALIQICVMNHLWNAFLSTFIFYVGVLLSMFYFITPQPQFCWCLLLACGPGWYVGLT